MTQPTNEQIAKTIDDLVDLSKKQEAIINKLEKRSNLLGDCFVLLDEALDACSNHNTTLGEIMALRGKFNDILNTNLEDNGHA